MTKLFETTKPIQYVFFIFAVSWMVVIFLFSSRNGVESTEDSHDAGFKLGSSFISGFDNWDEDAKLDFAAAIDYPIRKAAHAMEYALLMVFFVGALTIKRKYFAFFCTVVYAASDEIHQLFVPGRSGRAFDVFVDAMGAASVLLLIYVCKKYGPANFITFCRIVGSICLLFTPSLSLGFFVFYIFCGLTDMIDGTVARITKTTSRFGEVFDSLSDLIFVIVCAIKILPEIKFEVWLVVWIILITVTKIINYVSGLVCYKKITMPHTIANKLVGVATFLYVIGLAFYSSPYIAIPVCAIATFAAVQEGHFIRTGRV